MPKKESKLKLVNEDFVPQRELSSGELSPMTEDGAWNNILEHDGIRFVLEKTSADGQKNQALYASFVSDTGPKMEDRKFMVVNNRGELIEEWVGVREQKE